MTTSTSPIGLLRRRRVRLTYFRRLTPLQIVALAFLVLLALFAILDPVLPIHSGQQNLNLALLPPFSVGPSRWYLWLGADEFGRPLLGQLLEGARVSLAVGVISALVAMIVGTTIGVIAGVWRGWFEEVSMRVVDMFMGVPTMLIAIVFLFALGPSPVVLVITLASFRWMVFARVSRALTLTIREQQYYESVLSLGATRWRMVIKHVLPNISSRLLSLWTLEVATVILSEAALSYLGIGVQPPPTSWGLMLASAQGYLATSPLYMVLPGLLISLTTISISFLVGRERGALDDRAV